MQKGSIHLITGCMFAGKTTRLMDVACTFQAEDILVVKHASDTRYGTKDELYTHSCKTLPCIVTNRVTDILNHPSYAIVTRIFIDEGQFFDDLVQFCQVACERDGKHIHIAALNGDANRLPFPSIANVIPLVDATETLFAYCQRCHCSAKTTTKALFSYRKPATMGDGVSGVGAAEKYEALCRYHFIEASELGGT